MSYKEKYLKYKMKYLQLKEQLGGGFKEEIEKKERKIKELGPIYSKAYRAYLKLENNLQKLKEDVYNNEEYKSLKDTISKVQTEVWNLERKLRQPKAEIDRNESVLRSYFKTFQEEKDARDNLSNLEITVRDIEDQLKPKNDELNKLRKDRDEFKKKLLEQYSEESKKIEPEMNRLKNEYKGYGEEIHILERGINSIKNKQHDLYLKEKIKGFISYTDGLDSYPKLIEHIKKITKTIDNPNYILSERKWNRRKSGFLYYVGLFFNDIEADDLVVLIEIESFRNFIIRLGYLSKILIPRASDDEAGFARAWKDKVRENSPIIYHQRKIGRIGYRKKILKFNKFKDLITAKDINAKFKSKWEKNRSDKSNKFISSLINLNSLLSESDYEPENDEFRVKSDGYMAFGGN